jgi:hypothetical protein
VRGSNFGLRSEQMKLDLVLFDDEVNLSLEGESKKFRVEDFVTAVEFESIVVLSLQIEKHRIMLKVLSHLSLSTEEAC